MSKYGVFSGPYFPVSRLNTEIYQKKLRIWTLFIQYLFSKVFILKIKEISKKTLKWLLQFLKKKDTTWMYFEEFSEIPRGTVFQ